MNIADLADDDLRFGEYEALVVGDRSWTNRALHEEAQRLASAFIAAGIVPGDRIVLAVPSGRVALVASAATWKAGAVVVFVNPAAPANEVEQIVAHCAPAAFVAPAAMLARSAQLWKQAAGGDAPVAIATTSELGADYPVLDELIARHSPLARSISRSETDPAQLCYTSGSTGGPKAVVYTHGSRAAILTHFADEGIVVKLVALPPSAFGGMLLLDRWRKKLVIFERFEPAEFLAAITKHEITKLSLVPSMGEALVAINPNNECRATLRQLNISGAHTSPALSDALERMFGVRPTNMYGMTEVGAISEAHRDARAGSVGRLVPGVTVEIVDRAGTPRPSGEVGELRAKSPWMAVGYWQDPVETAAVFRDGWVYSGDLGKLDADNFLFLVGRSKDIIIQAGFNIAPREVAEVVMTAPGVAHCEVVGLPDSVLGEEVVACVVRAPGSTITAQEVLGHCGAHLDARKLPGRVMFLDALPMTATGKVKLVELREWVIRQASSTKEPGWIRRLRDATRADQIARLRELVIAELVTVMSAGGAATLEAASIDPDASFSDLGLKSMKGVQMMAALSTRLGRKLPVTLPYAHPSVSKLARQLAAMMFGAPTATAAPAKPERPKEPAPADQVLVVGIGCRMPPALDDPAAFWEFLANGGDAARRVPAGRWLDAPDKTREFRASFRDSIDGFDAAFFKLGSSASGIDPQQRMLLEVTWEALENAGHDPLALAGKPIGVFLGIYGGGYVGGDMLGVSASMAGARICHFFDFHGPMVAIDTACSSSLVALHYAVQSIRAGDCDTAIVGGVHLTSTPRWLAGLEALGVLAPDGTSKAFDASANGFGRGEGCVVFVLERAREEIAGAVRAWAIVRGSAVNHDGAASSLTAPNPIAQEALLRKAIRAARVAPDEIQYVDAHGTGTVLGDPIEVDALHRVFGRRSTPLAIGTVKSNIGHLEAAAGLAGCLKVLLSMAQRQLPPSIHFKDPNPYIPWNEISIAVQSKLGPWPSPDRPLIAGVSSFGLAGTNAHVVFEAAPVESQVRWQAADERAAIGEPEPLLISAKTADGLAAYAASFAKWLERDDGEHTYRDIAYTASCRRTHFAHRLSVLGRNRSEWAERLREFGRTGMATGLVHGVARETSPGLVMMFCGQGSQWWGMGRELWAREPVYRRAMEACAAAIDARVPWRLLEELGRDEATSRIDHTEVAQPALFALQVSLCELWRSWGVVPSVVYGHSMGEIAAAYVAGAMTLESAAWLSTLRARIAQKATGRGQMAAVELSAAEAEAVLADYPGVEIGASNGPVQTMLSGRADALHAALATLEARGVTCRVLKVDYASHSAQIEGLDDELRAALSGLPTVAPRIRLLSTVTAGDAPALDAAYWGRQLRQPVRFYETTKVLVREGHRRFLEIGPHPVLAPGVVETLDDHDVEGRVVASLRRKTGEQDMMRSAFGELHCTGYPIDWPARFGIPGRLVTMPNYPWQRRRYWYEETPLELGRPAAPAEANDQAQRDVTATGLHLVPESQRSAVVGQRVLDLVATMTDLPIADIDRDAVLTSFGLDSFRLIELRRNIETALGITFPKGKPLKTIESIVTTVLAHVATGIQDSARVLRLERTTKTTCLATVAQAASWHLNRDLDVDPMGNIGFTIISMVGEVEGPLDRILIGKAVEHVCRRHAVFTTTYRDVEGLIYQDLPEPPGRPIEVEFADVSSDPGTWEEKQQAACIRIWSRPFDLTVGPALRFLLISESATRHTLIVVMQHSAMDGGMLAKFFADLSSAYAALEQGTPLPEPDPADLQYIDFADYLVRHSESPDGRAQRDYWKRQLEGAPALNIPTDFSRDALEARRDRRAYGLVPCSTFMAKLVLERAHHAHVLEICKQSGATPYVVFLAAYAAFLHDICQQDDVCIQSSLNHRQLHPALRTMPGAFPNFLVMRIDTSGNPSFEELVRRTNDVVAAAHENGLHRVYDLAPHQIRRTNFNYLPYVAPAAATPPSGNTRITWRQPFSASRQPERAEAAQPREGSAIRAAMVHSPRTPFDIHIWAVDSPNSTYLHMLVNRELFREGSCERLLQRYHAILCAL